MYAARLHAFGPPENLTYEEVPDPLPGPGQVRIRVQASGVHLLDATLRAGRRLGPLPLPELPTVPGREVAGTVTSLGEGTDAGWLGRRVTVHLGAAPGGYAELAVADAAALQAIPETLTPAQAVAMIGTGRTVMGVLRGTDLGPDDTVLVLSAIGGMGALLTQYAKHRGAHVIGAAGGQDKTAAVSRLGADLAVDYTRADWSERIRAAYGERPVRHLFDGPGGVLARTALDLLAPGGTHHAYGGSSTLLSVVNGPSTTDAPPATDAPTTAGRPSTHTPGDDTDGSSTQTPGAEEAAARDLTVRPLDPAFIQTHKRELENESLTLAADGVLTPLVHPFPLAQAAAAHRALETRGTTGKVVLVP
ncbi:zinc-binding dehydrogenase [Streptomyces tubbatahanensis]|uniref:Zinc-binding dehydrogenase n=1 Tax=Streptomyces tubbatahanensis TaxID=2923272 RepID=A0ABY3XTF8_9ACTN|nr:zinc-binding dehydrogenase [Streptomyces tubbatahanensis]UNS97659.1 zinc-binding dehydrogenase [Streptomyces tubbatahanensis]